MSVDIKHADYKQIFATAARVRDGAEQFRNVIQQIYDRVGRMNTDEVWYGKKYDELVEVFERIQPEFVKIIKAIAVDVPLNLEQIGNNYAKGEGLSGYGSGEVAKTDIVVPVKSNKGEQVAFRQQLVEGAITEISDLFNKNAMERLEGIANIVLGMDNIWDSGAASQYRNKFKELRASLENAINDVLTQFKNLMNDQIASYGNTESSVTVE